MTESDPTGAAGGDQLRARVNRLQRQLDGARRAEERCEARSEKYDLQRQRLAARVDKLLQRAAAAEQTAQKLSERNEKLVQRESRLGERAESDQRRLAESKRRTDAAQAQAARLRSGAERLSEQLEIERERVRRLKTQADRARAQVDDLKATVDAQRQSREKLRQKILALAWRPGYARNPRYVAARRRFLEHCIERGRLPRDGAVLDVGCGIGGVAEQLALYLDDDGSYDGFDVSARAIEFANQIVGPVHPNFRFRLADVWNSKYNPEGAYQPEEFPFPYDDASFDLTVLRSVFTHMLPDQIDHYVGEIARTLKPGGRCLITYFLIDDESRPLFEDEDSGFPYDFGGYRLSDEDVVEARVALELDWVRDTYRRHGLSISDEILLGDWRRKDAESLDGQDLVTAVRVG